MIQSLSNSNTSPRHNVDSGLSTFGIGHFNQSTPLSSVRFLSILINQYPGIGFDASSSISRDYGSGEYVVPGRRPDGRKGNDFPSFFAHHVFLQELLVLRKVPVAGGHPYRARRTGKMRLLRCDHVPRPGEGVENTAMWDGYDGPNPILKCQARSYLLYSTLLGQRMAPIFRGSAH